MYGLLGYEIIFEKFLKPFSASSYILNVRSLIYARFNLKIYYPSPYEREICHYKKANIDLIQQAIHEFNWERAFHRININEKVHILINTINNVLSNLIPHEIKAWMIRSHHGLIRIS